MVEHVAMIPARIGSQRLKKKNLAILCGKPLIEYAVSAAKKSRIFDKIYINADDIIFRKIAERNKVEFYLRPTRLGSNKTKSDHVVFDFLKNINCTTVSWINSIAPLQTYEEIREIFHYFKKNNLDTLHTVRNNHLHHIFKNKPVNFKTSEIFSRTQELAPVKSFVYSTMIWRKDTFVKNMKTKKFAFFSGKVGYFEVSENASKIIKTKEDLFMCETILKNLKKFKVSYLK